MCYDIYSNLSVGEVCTSSGSGDTTHPPPIPISCTPASPSPLPKLRQADEAAQWFASNNSSNKNKSKKNNSASHVGAAARTTGISVEHPPSGAAGAHPSSPAVPLALLPMPMLADISSASAIRQVSQGRGYSMSCEWDRAAQCTIAHISVPSLSWFGSFSFVLLSFCLFCLVHQEDIISTLQSLNLLRQVP